MISYNVCVLLPSTIFMYECIVNLYAPPVLFKITNRNDSNNNNVIIVYIDSPYKNKVNKQHTYRHRDGQKYNCQVKTR